MRLYFSRDLEWVFSKIGITPFISIDDLNILLKNLRKAYISCFSELFNINSRNIIHVNYLDIVDFLLKQDSSSSTISLFGLMSNHSGFTGQSLSISRVYDSLTAAADGNSHPILIVNQNDFEIFIQTFSGPFTILDDGIYSGSTLRQVIRLLHGCNAQIQQIITYFNFSSFDYFDEIPIKSALKANKDLTIDRICERDILVGIPNAGFKYLNGSNINSQSYITNTSVFHKHTSCPKNMSLYGCRKLLDISEVFWSGVRSSVGDTKYRYICSNILTCDPLDLIVSYKSKL